MRYEPKLWVCGTHVMGVQWPMSSACLLCRCYFQRVVTTLAMPIYFTSHVCWIWASGQGSNGPNGVLGRGNVTVGVMSPVGVTLVYVGVCMHQKFRFLRELAWRTRRWRTGRQEFYSPPLTRLRGLHLCSDIFM
jgi:hypothetical protein